MFDGLFSIRLMCFSLQNWGTHQHPPYSSLIDRLYSSTVSMYPIVSLWNQDWHQSFLKIKKKRQFLCLLRGWISVRFLFYKSEPCISGISITWVSEHVLEHVWTLASLNFDGALSFCVWEAMCRVLAMLRHCHYDLLRGVDQNRLHDHRLGRVGDHATPGRGRQPREWVGLDGFDSRFATKWRSAAEWMRNGHERTEYLQNPTCLALGDHALGGLVSGWSCFVHDGVAILRRKFLYSSRPHHKAWS